MNIQKSNVESVVSCADSWEDVNWHKIEKYVNKLQMRIYSAEKNGKFRKVRELQRMLMNSKQVLLLAIRRVTQKNKGKRTAGVDGYRAVSNRRRMSLFNRMKDMNINLHRPKPVYRVGIPKKNGKIRYLGIPVIIDRVYQEILRMALEPQAEVNFEPTSYGFRPKRNQHDALVRIRTNMQRGNWVWIFEGDFKACFDNIDHDFILKQLKGFPAKRLVERFLKAGYVENNAFGETNKGTPQGGLISPLLANIALTGLEKYLNITYYTSPKGKHSSRGDYRVVRFADDFVIFAKTKDDILKVRDILAPYLEERGLELAEDKTRITHATEGFDFLGFNCKYYPDRKRQKCQIQPSKNSQKEFKDKIRNIFKTHRGNNVNTLLKRLNPVLIGNVNYWRPFNSRKVISKLDNYIWFKVKKFIRRLHPQKPWKWIIKKYFPPNNNGRFYGKWILTDPIEGLTIVKMARFRQKYHVIIAHNNSPYDPEKVKYFEKRAERHQKLRYKFA